MTIAGAVLLRILQLVATTLDVAYVRTALAHDPTSPALTSQLSTVLLSTGFCVPLLVVSQFFLVSFRIRFVEIGSFPLFSSHFYKAFSDLDFRRGSLEYPNPSA